MHTTIIIRYESLQHVCLIKVKLIFYKTRMYKSGVIVF